jgi:enoyl-CoA hydratase/carnithine racemase
VSDDSVLRELSGGVLLLTLNRPRQRNAFNDEMYDALRDALAGAQEDDDVRVVVVTGSAGAFSAGQDLGEMASPPPRTDGEPHGFSSFMDRLCIFDKPLLAAVNGVGVGIGLTLLLHCDVVYMAEGARIRAPFVTLGVVPEAASSYLLPLLLGPRKAVDVLYTAEWIDAPRAVELGISNRVCAADALLPAILERAAALAKMPPEALRHTKRLLLATREDGIRAARRREDAAFRVRVGSPENREAIRAFFEKREPDFSKR